LGISSQSSESFTDEPTSPAGGSLISAILSAIVLNVSFQRGHEAKLSVFFSFVVFVVTKHSFNTSVALSFGEET